MKRSETIRIGVIGLGYVGLPLAVEFGKKFHTIGFDLKEDRIAELVAGEDSTREVDPEDFVEARNLIFTSDSTLLADCNYFIIAVPTPIDSSKRPNLQPLISATEIVAVYLKKDDIVVYESTVYPGATEEVCVPILEKVSGLVYNDSFFCGYSPERINPGDREHRLTNIVKITSGSTVAAARKIDDLYREIIDAGTFAASSIKVAEAAKVIENTQRDVNIALVNELALIFNRLDINTQEVLQAAGTKWNFLRFTPGLVGGHCIGVDPYYLTHKAQEVGYHPAMILAGRRLNDDMGTYVADRFIKLMLQKKINVAQARILVLGLTFKENCPDLRNTKVVDIIHELQEHGITVEVYDPWVDPDEAVKLYGLQLEKRINRDIYDGMILAVNHDSFKSYSAKNLRNLMKPKAILFDVKGVLSQKDVDGSL